MRFPAFIAILVFSFACSGNDIATNASFDQDYLGSRIYGKVDGLPANKVFLYSLYGDQINLLDSALADREGSFQFSLPRQRDNGLYRLTMGGASMTGQYDQNRQQLDLIWDGTTVVFQTNYATPVDSMQIILSEENRLYYQLLTVMEEYDLKIGVLTNALLQYPSGGNFKQRLEREYRREQNRRSNFIDNLIKKNRGTVFSSIAGFYKLPAIKAPGSDEDMEGLRKNFFSKDQLADPVMMHTDLIPRRIMRYLSLYSGNQYDPDDREYELIEGVDVIMQHAAGDEEIFYFIAEYLFNGFESMDMDIVAEHIMSSYILGEECLEGEMTDQRAAVLAGGNFAEGDKVPGFDFTTREGRYIKLDEISASHTLLVFWGSWCPYCEDVMADLAELYEMYKATNDGFLEIIAIGIEDDVEMWQNRIETEKYPWINFSSLQRWDCPIAREYNIGGTPTMILLDGEKRFLREPARVRILARDLARRERAGSSQ